MAETPSHKRLAVYSSSTFTTEAREVPIEVVVQALRASSMFFEEDIRALAPKIAPELATLEEDERLVVETNDTAVHVFITNNEVQIVSFRQGHETSRHSSAIPSMALKTELAPRPATARPTQVVTPTPPPAEVRPAEVRPVEVTPPIQHEPTPVVVAKPKPKTPPKAAPRPAPKPVGSRLTEPEIRTRLAELDRLRAKQLITELEYEQKRKALLDQL